MITREQIYSKEAASLLRTITMYQTVLEEQLFRFYPEKKDKVQRMLTRLTKQGRIFYDVNRKSYSASAECAEHPDQGMIAAVWVLLDFITRVEYHTVSDYPVKISFFSAGELYEIVYVSLGQEFLMNHALTAKETDDARRIILVDKPEQIRSIQIMNTAGFCTVTNGTVNYFKLE